MASPLPALEGPSDSPDSPAASSSTHYAMVDPTNFVTGRLDPVPDENVFALPALVVEEKKDEAEGWDWDDSLESTTPPYAPSPAPYAYPTDKPSQLLSLPAELISHILMFLGPLDLVAASATCHTLLQQARNDICWQHHVQDNVPGVTLTSPGPCKSYRELYVAHDPHWFLTKYKLWFCDFYMTGKLLIARYDPRRGCIEAYRLVAERSAPSFVSWEADPEVIIHSFEPKCRLHKDVPILQLEALTLESLVSTSCRGSNSRRYSAETPMLIHNRARNGIFSTFFLARPVQERSNMSLWPPTTIPARQRVRNASQQSFMGEGHRPQKRSEISSQAFRIRRWMEMSSNGSPVPGMHLGEEVNTYATLDPKLYTPTEEKPWRGIWVGDYSGHGCEFMLMNQPDNDTPFDESSVVQGEDETPEEYETRKRDQRIYRGKIEAIKLTGDPNVPRGEITFTADDLSDKGFVRVATEERFKGARIVRSRGHIAARMFRNASQLIMLSHNRLAQYWEAFGHISFYERVDIDSFLNPSDDPLPSASSTSKLWDD